MEVFHNGRWGTVCDDGWDIDDARVVCRQLGFPDAVAAYQGSRVPDGTGQIWLDGVRCTGDESSLFSCSHKGLGVHNCGHAEDAGVLCEVKRTSGSGSGDDDDDDDNDDDDDDDDDFIIEDKVLSIPRSRFQLFCDSNYMTAVVDRRNLPKHINIDRLYLRDRNCKAQWNSTHVIVKTLLSGCGTVFSKNDQTLFFSNVLSEESNSLSVGNITRDYLLRANLTCTYPRKRTVVSFSFAPAKPRLFVSLGKFMLLFYAVMCSGVDYVCGVVE